MANVDAAEKVGRLIKFLKEEYELWSWIIHTKAMIAKCQDLAADRGMLETIVGDKIMNEDMKRWFLRGNNDTGQDGGGLKNLEAYLLTESVRQLIAMEERSCVQLDKTNGNRLRLIDYVERKYQLLLAREKRWRDDEGAAWPEVLISIKLDMCAEDIKLLGPTTVYDSKLKFILACESFSSLEKRVKEEKNVVLH